MKKVNMKAAKQTKNFSERQLTIGLDLGDRSSWYCVLDEAGSVTMEQQREYDSESHARDVRRNAALPCRTGNWDALAMGEPVVDGTGTRGDRGACA